MVPRQTGAPLPLDPAGRSTGPETGTQSPGIGSGSACSQRRSSPAGDPTSVPLVLGRPPPLSFPFPYNGTQHNTCLPKLLHGRAASILKSFSTTMTCVIVFKVTEFCLGHNQFHLLKTKRKEKFNAFFLAGVAL